MNAALMEIQKETAEYIEKLQFKDQYDSDSDNES